MCDIDPPLDEIGTNIADADSYTQPPVNTAYLDSLEYLLLTPWRI